MKTVIITLFALMCSIAPLRSQTYSFQATTAPYANLTNPISLNNGEVWVFPDYTIPIGFNFWYFHEYIDTLYFFEESAAMLSTSNVEGGFHKLIFPFGAMLIDRGYGTSQSLSPLSYELSGELGNRILKIEWQNVGFGFEYDAINTLNDYVNFQLWLYETSGNIEMRFGPSKIMHPEFAYIDVSGPSVALIPQYNFEEDTVSSASLWLQGNPGNPVMVQTDEFTFLEGSIPPNTVFQFNKLTVGSIKNPLNAAIVYPNPAKDYLTIRLLNNFTSLAEISISDINGRIVYQSAHNPNQTGELQVPVSALNGGVYQVVIRQGEGVSNTRFVKL
ncbi:MAG: T9SS type A sorting domain-containing protein [Lentimicrobium sp.]|jgi:hypothetical protein|nr:T9SS type A sorting domain-containing protein [Lentimicrobium sp.]